MRTYRFALCAAALELMRIDDPLLCRWGLSRHTCVISMFWMGSYRVRWWVDYLVLSIGSIRVPMATLCVDHTNYTLVALLLGRHLIISLLSPVI